MIFSKKKANQLACTNGNSTNIIYASFAIAPGWGKIYACVYIACVCVCKCKTRLERHQTTICDFFSSLLICTQCYFPFLNYISLKIGYYPLRIWCKTNIFLGTCLRLLVLRVCLHSTLTNVIEFCFYLGSFQPLAIS